MNDQQLLERIACDRRGVVGKPVFKGTRLTVEFIRSASKDEEEMENHSGRLTVW